MCEPITWTTALTAAGLALSTGTALYGAKQSSDAQTSQANAIRDQNFATSQAQSQAFNQRMAATRAQSDAQFDTAQRESAARTTAAQATRAAQLSALNRQNETIGAENTTASELRAEADARAQDLLASTTAPAMDQSQKGAQDQAAALLAASQAPGPTGPAATDPSGSGASTSTNDPMTKSATARRMGIAAANIRQYGADIAKVASYGQPLQNANLAIKGNQTDIMPAQTAEALLQSGSASRLLPSRVQYSNATDYGGAADQAIQARAAGENTYSGLAFGNATAGANLGQSDADIAAANKAKQAQADAEWQKSMGGLYAGLGNLAGYAAGRYGSAILPGSEGKSYASNIDTTSNIGRS